MVGNLFFSGSCNDLKMNLKTVVKPTNEQIADILIALFPKEFTDNGNSEAKSQKLIADSLVVLDDSIESIKRHIQANEGTIVGYAYIIIEKIACPSCSDVNYLLITDNNYTIKHIIFLRDIVEGYKIITVEKFEELSNQFLGMSLLNSDFSSIEVVSNPEKHSIYFKESINRIQKQVRLFYGG